MSPAVCIMHSLKLRNNARTNLGLGLAKGFSETGVDHRLVPDTGELLLDTAAVPQDTEIVVIPYWISPQLWKQNIGQLRAERPSATIVAYTGSSPFWEGCPWVDYRPVNRSLEPRGLSSAQETDAFNAIDLYCVVFPRISTAPTKQETVGMGLFEDLVPGAKNSTPLVVIDQLKEGWDEPQYTPTCVQIDELAAKHSDWRFLVLGTNRINSRMAVRQNVTLVPVYYTPWSQLISWLKAAWAYVVFNESFGYTVVEAFACGTQVFQPSGCERPLCHEMCLPMTTLEEHVSAMSRSATREAEAMELSRLWREYHPQLISWPDASRRLLEAAYGVRRTG